MKILILFFLLLFTAHSQNQKSPKRENFLLRFRSVKCQNFDNSTAIFSFCFIKAYSPTVTTLNFRFEVFRDLKTFFIQIIVDYRYGTVYREVLNTKLVDFCAMMESLDHNLLLKHIFDTVSGSMPKLFQKCPIERVGEFYNVTMDKEQAKKGPGFFPEGFYK